MMATEACPRGQLYPLARTPAWPKCPTLPHPQELKMLSPCCCPDAVCLDFSVLGCVAESRRWPWKQQGPCGLPLTRLHIWGPQGVAVHTQPFVV